MPCLPLLVLFLVSSVLVSSVFMAAKGRHWVMRVLLLLCLQEEAIAEGADRGDPSLCNSGHGDQAAHRGE